MPRLMLKMTGNDRFSQPDMWEAATAVEAGSLCYVTSVDMLRTGQPLLMRCVLASALWYGYGKMLDNM